MKDSAGVKFNENTELIIEADPTGEVTSCRNVINGVEYVGGGGEPQNLIFLSETEYDVSTTDTTVQTVGTFTLNDIEEGDTLFFVTEDTAGARSGYFLKSLQLSYIKGTGTNSTNYYSISDLSGVLYVSGSAAGVYVSSASLASGGSGVLTITVSSKYNATSSRTIDGTYKIRVYKMVY